MRTNCIAAIIVLAAIVLPTVVLGITSPNAQADQPGAAQTNAPAGTAPVKAPMSACPMCSMAEGVATSKDMPPAMKQHCDMMIKAELSKDDASCLLALKQELKLTPEQVQQLDQILKESREKAAALLTPEQQKSLVECTGQPMSMKTMHSRMHGTTMQKMDSPAKMTPKDKEAEKPEGAASSAK
ncbi:MAG: hypothetical protein HZB26_05350 [Candidatus Hydrogenedentes bacterium]|nr:hypothetical protein [Candidatus Hydrogenedentota bacterium]